MSGALISAALLSAVGDLPQIAAHAGFQLTVARAALLIALAASVYIFWWFSQNWWLRQLRARSLMTPSERTVIRALERILPHCRIHAQVSMGALIGIKRSFTRQSGDRLRWKFSQKIVDFVIEDRRSDTILALVELDDGSHSARLDRARDRMTAAAGYATIRLPASARPTLESVRAALRNAGLI